MSDEYAKAAQEIAKATSKGMELVQKIGKFLGMIVGPAAAEVGGSLQDWAKYHRYKQMLRIQDKVEAVHAARRLEGRTIPIAPRYAIPLVEKASQEDNESLQDMWAGLIANATDPDRGLNLQKVFIDVLAGMEPLDALILRHLDNQGWLMFRNVPNGGITVPMLSEALGTPKRNVYIALQNLHRLQLVGDEFALSRDGVGTSTFGLRVTQDGTTFRPSQLGSALLKACEIDG